MIDFTQWKLNLPVDKDGLYKGDAQQVKPIPEGYELRPFFYKINDGYIFAAPVEGAKTSKNTKYSRMEASELIKGKEARWTTKQGGRMEGQLSAVQLPLTDKGYFGRIVVAQIHGRKEELCRLYYDNGKVYFYDDKAGISKKETKFELKSASGATPLIPLGEPFAYRILVKDGKLGVIVTYKGEVYAAEDKLSSYWKNKEETCYFKFGCYLQVGRPGSGAGTVGSGKGVVKYNYVKVTH